MAVDDRQVVVCVTDDGHGGARAAPGRGLGGLRDRVAAFGGSLELVSPPGAGTTVRAMIPLDQAMSGRA